MPGGEWQRSRGVEEAGEYGDVGLATHDLLSRARGIGLACGSCTWDAAAAPFRNRRSSWRGRDYRWESGRVGALLSLTDGARRRPLHGKIHGGLGRVGQVFGSCWGLYWGPCRLLRGERLASQEEGRQQESSAENASGHSWGGREGPATFRMPYRPSQVKRQTQRRLQSDS